jgi:hypothetical protein
MIMVQQNIWLFGYEKKLMTNWREIFSMQSAQIVKNALFVLPKTLLTFALIYCKPITSK